ncbi:MAG TPA: glycosyltransferase family 4 protein, partial [Patescibacteria group bacterium]|nr:glycosyltransferase family 4 protein [Patescibacteria group bacterium]
MQENKQKRLLLAHDSFTQEGGAERVFSLLGKMFPGADVYVLLRDKRMAKYASQFKHIITSPLQVLYKFFPKFKYYLPLIPLG